MLLKKKKKKKKKKKTRKEKKEKKKYYEIRIVEVMEVATSFSCFIVNVKVTLKPQATHTAM